METIMLKTKQAISPMKTILTLGLWLLSWAKTELVVTNRRIVWRKGLINTDERSIPLNQITDVQVRQGIVGKIFGYGNVQIESAGGPLTEIVAENVRGPKRVRDAILDQLWKIRQN